MIKLGRYISAQEPHRSESGLTLLWSIVDTGGEVIGTVKWFSPWRKYCFYPLSQTIYDEECMRDLADFCKEKNKEHKK